ncbi:MAG: GNAT family N-acetyltransferase [Bacillota bacterium]
MTRIELFLTLREELEALFQGRLNVFLISEEINQSANTFSVLFVGQPKDGETAGKGQPGRGEVPEKVIVGRYAELKNRFYNKNVPPFSEEFLLDLGYDYGAGVCVVHYLNLPVLFRGRGAGAQVVKKIEKLGKQVGIRTISVPAEHNAVNFWLKQGYSFTNAREKEFFQRHEDRNNLFIAYDLHKNLSNFHQEG